MSDLNNSENIEQVLEKTGPTERELLIQRANTLGIKYSNNISTEKLRERVSAHILDTAENEDKQEEEIKTEEKKETVVKEAVDESVPLTRLQLKNKAMMESRKENLRLVRLRITNMDPKKADLPGEVLTVANNSLGTIRKYIPFGEATDEGFHVPFVLYKLMRDRKFLQIKTITNKQTNTNRVETRWVREFSLEILDPLTKDEIQQLATAQQAAGSISGEDNEKGNLV